MQIFLINYDYFIILALSPPSKEILITSLSYFTKKVTCGSLCETLSTLIFRFPNFNLFEIENSFLHIFEIIMDGIMTSFFCWKQTWGRVDKSVERRKGILWSREDTTVNLQPREQKKLFRVENSKKSVWELIAMS